MSYGTYFSRLGFEVWPRAEIISIDLACFVSQSESQNLYNFLLKNGLKCVMTYSIDLNLPLCSIKNCLAGEASEKTHIGEQRMIRSYFETSISIL